MYVIRTFCGPQTKHQSFWTYCYYSFGHQSLDKIIGIYFYSFSLSLTQVRHNNAIENERFLDRSFVHQFHTMYSEKKPAWKLTITWSFNRNPTNAFLSQSCERNIFNSWKHLHSLHSFKTFAFLKQSWIVFFSILQRRRCGYGVFVNWVIN